MEDKKRTKAKFNQVSAEIEKRIHEGIYVSSQKLPSEYDLAKEFDCSRLTIRKAIDDLIGKNILVKRRGKGSYVMSQPKIQSGRSGLQGFTEAAKAYGKTSSTEVISFKKVSGPSEEILNALQLEEDQPIYELVRRRILDDEPMTVEKIYLSEFYVKGLKAEDFSGSLFKLLEEKPRLPILIRKWRQFWSNRSFQNYWMYRWRPLAASLFCDLCIRRDTDFLRYLLLSLGSLCL